MLKVPPDVVTGGHLGAVLLAFVSSSEVDSAVRIEAMQTLTVLFGSGLECCVELVSAALETGKRCEGHVKLIVAFAPTLRPSPPPLILS